MRNFNRRIEKAEQKVQLREKEAKERKAKLLEIQKLGNDDSLQALLLKLELEQGCKLSIIDLIAMAQIQQQQEDSCRM
jgi:hypothetical protein